MRRPRANAGNANPENSSGTLPATKGADAAAKNDHVYALDGVVGYQLRRAYTLFSAQWQFEFRDKRYPITPVQGGMLVMIDANRNVTPTMLARMMNVESPTLLQSLDRLEELGYIRKLRNESDRRSYTLHLTPRGRKALSAVRAFGPEREEALLADLSPQERRQLLDFLTRIVARGRTVVRSLQEESAAASVRGGKAGKRSGRTRQNNVDG